MKRSPTPDDSALVTSNLSKNRSIRRSVAPKIATLPDDDPPSLERLDDQHESSSDKDGDMYEEGRDDIQFLSSINAININNVAWPPSADVHAEPTKTPFQQDPEAVRAQIAGQAQIAKVSCAEATRSARR